MAIKGKDLIFYISINGISQPLAYSKNCTLVQTAETLETTTKGSGAAKSFNYGRTSYKLTVTSLTDLTDSNYSSLFLQNCLNNRVKVLWSFQLSGTQYYSGQVLVTQAQLDAAFDGVSGFSCELIGDGGVTISATIPPISQNFNYLRIYQGDYRLSVDGNGMQVVTDPSLVNRSGYPIFATQLSTYFKLSDISYNPAAGSFTILAPGFLVATNYDLIIYPYQIAT